ncbi:MAG: LptF/LptG family permease [Gemmatimonadota bacterium]|nr:LptF/LptG family permease [Gemmatimonadota bacterium]
MKILTRYVLKEHIGPLIFALAALTSLLMLQFVARQLGNLVGKGLPWRVIGEFFVLSIPFTVAMTLPMAVLVATLHAFGRMASEHEVTAFKASGVRVTALMMPVFIGAAFLALGMVAFNDQVLPRANHRLRILQQDMSRTKPTLALSEQVLNQVTAGFYMRIGKLDRESNRMTDVTIYDLSQPLSRKTIYADSGDLSFTPDKKDLQLVLFDGYQQELTGTNSNTAMQLRRTFFRSQAVRVKDIGGDFEQTGSDSWKGDREKSICEMQNEYVLDAREYERVRQVFIETARLAAVPGQKTMRVPKPRPASEGLAKLYCNALALVFRVRTGTPPALANQQQSVPVAGSPGLAVSPPAVAGNGAGGALTPMPGIGAGSPPLNTNRVGTVAVAPGTTILRDRQTPVTVPAAALTPGMQAQLEAARRSVQPAAPQVVAQLSPVKDSANAGGKDSSKASVPVVAGRSDSTPPTSVPAPAGTVPVPNSALVVQPPLAGVVPVTGTPQLPIPPASTPAQAAGQSPVQVPVPPVVQAPVAGQLPLTNPNIGADLGELTSANGPAALAGATSQLQVVRESMDSLAVEVQKKFALSFACIVFVLFGPPIALRFPRGGVGATLGVSLIVFGLYYVCLSAGETLADDGKLPPWVAMWIANVIFTIIGLLLLLRIEKTADASRGGGLRAWFEERKARRVLRIPGRPVSPTVAT